MDSLSSQSGGKAIVRTGILRGRGGGWGGVLGQALPSPLPVPDGIQNGSSLCFRKFRPFHHQFKSFPEVSFLGPKDASPFEATTTPGSSHCTRWVLLV